MSHRFRLQRKPKDDKSSDPALPLQLDISEVNNSRPGSSKEPAYSLQTVSSRSNSDEKKKLSERKKIRETTTGADSKLLWDDFSDDFFELLITEGAFDEKQNICETTKPYETPSVTLESDLCNEDKVSKSSISVDSSGGQFGCTSNFTEMSGATSVGRSSTQISLSKHNENQSQIGFTKKKSFTQTTSSQAHTTEWLRNQLEKLNKECSLLKENISTKEGESKILRDRLNEANLTIEKQKKEKEVEHQTLRLEYEQKIKGLEKDLQLAKTEIMIKTIEEKSHIERYKDNLKVSTPEHPPSTSSRKSFRKFLSEKEKASKAYSFLSQKRSSDVITSTKPLAKIESEKPLYPADVNAVKTACHDKLNILPNAIPFANERNIEHLGEELKSIIYPFLFTEASEEYSFIVPPAVDYYPFDILYRDVSEIPTTVDPKKVQNNLKKIWNIQLEQDEEKRACEKPIRRSRYFTSLKEIYSKMFDICRLPKWDHSSLIDFIIEHVTKMARELYIALRDPAVLAETTISLRENEVIDDCLDTSELKKNFNPFSPKKWKKEIYVDLRRAIALISAMCELDKSVGKTVLLKSRFILDKECTKQYYKRCQLPHTTGKWYDEDLYLSSSMQLALDTFESNQNWDNIHSTDNFIKENYEVGELTALLQNLSSEQCHLWKKRLQELEQEDLAETLLEYRSRRFSESLGKQLFSMKATLTSSKEDNSSKSPIAFPDVCVDDSNKHSEELNNFQSHIESKIKDSWAAISDDMMLPEENIKSPTSKTNKLNESVMATLMQKEEVKWVSTNLSCLFLPCFESRSTLLSKMSSQNCVSEMERELLSSAFHNFLKIKSALTGKENMCQCQRSDIKDQHGLFVKHEEDKIEEKSTTKDESIKKKQFATSTISSSLHCRTLPSTSSSSVSWHAPKFLGKSRFLRKKRDLAPLKKKQLDECKPLTLQESADIEDAVSKIYEADTDCEIRSSSDESTKASDDLAPHNQNESISKARDREERKHSYEKSEEVQDDSELLDILLGIVQRIGLMRYTSNFNALFAVIIQLLQSCLKAEIPAAVLRPKKIFQLILEILYCRPSPMVIRNINYFFVHCMPITGFARLICNNAHPKTCIIHNERISFKRGACFLSTICSLITFSIKDDNWDIQFQLFRWLAYIFFVEKTTIDYLYDNQKTTCGRCKCVRTLNNTIMSILSKAAAYYYSCSIEKKMTSLLKYQLTEIIEHGIRMISVIVEVDKFFAKNSFCQYDSFILFLETVTFMNSDDKNVFNIQLDEKDMKTIKLLLEEENIVRNLKKRSCSGDEIETEVRRLFASFHTVWPREMFFPQEFLESTKLYFDIKDED